MSNDIITQHLSDVVNSMVDQVSTGVDARIQTMIANRVQEAISAIDLDTIINEQVHLKLQDKLAGVQIDTGAIQGQIDALTSTVVNNLNATAQTTINQTVQDQTAKTDFNAILQGTIKNHIADKIANYTFPDDSIPGTAIDTSTLILSGNTIIGGIITNFASTGIDDTASSCQLTIMDQYTVNENTFVTQGLSVKGNAVVEGDLIVTGTVPNDSPMFTQLTGAVTAQVLGGLDNHLFVNYSDLVMNRLKVEGIDVGVIKLNGQPAISAGALAPSIIESNLVTLGLVRNFKSIGDNLLNQTLYVTNQRVGVNTIQPAMALSVWDQEVELGMGKRSSDVAVFGTPRSQALVLSSNGSNNITLNTDGSVSVNTINLGGISISASNTPPSYEAGQGVIVFNTNPTLGGPIGWVSLGGARWANFGIID